MNIHTIILAAGKGTRMNTNLPKVMQPLGGATLISHVINTAQKTSTNITAVIGYEKKILKKLIHEAYPSIQTVEQEKQLGTAHAVKQAMHLIKPNEKVLVLYGDVPLITNKTIKSLISSSKECCLLCMHLDDPTGYGRVMTNNKGHAIKIIEHKDASDEQRKIHEVFTGTLVVEGQLLIDALEEIDNKNAANEYYARIFNKKHLS